MATPVPDGWNYMAGRITGDGEIDIVETELPLTIASVERTLSVAPTLTGTIEHSVKQLKVNGKPVFKPWNTVILAEADGILKGGGILRPSKYSGSTWSLDVVGFSGYIKDMPYDGIQVFANEDPLNIFRHVWNHVQSQPRGNLGVSVDDTGSPVRIGTTDSEGEDPPREMNWWSTHDLAKVVDDLAVETPFDWLEQLSWQNGVPHCHLRLGYPRIGERKDNITGLVLGMNLETVPTITEGEAATQAWCLGAGEGREMVRGYAGVYEEEVRRVKVIQDDSILATYAANARAGDALAAARGSFVVDTLQVVDHPNARLEALELGDDVPLYAETEHVTLDQHVRIIGKSEAPGNRGAATLTVMRTVTL